MAIMFCMTMNIFENSILPLTLISPLTMSTGEKCDTIAAEESPVTADISRPRAAQHRRGTGAKMSLTFMSAVWEMVSGSLMNQFTAGTAATATRIPRMKQREVNISASLKYLPRISPSLEPRSLRVAISLALLPESAVERLM